jgi:hypothetical protein
LSARPLFGKDKFSACKISPALTQEEGDLKSKHDCTVQILVQTVEIADAALGAFGPRDAESLQTLRSLSL